MSHPAPRSAWTPPQLPDELLVHILRKRVGLCLVTDEGFSDPHQLVDDGPAITIMCGVCKAWRLSLAGDAIRQLCWDALYANFPRAKALIDASSALRKGPCSPNRLSSSKWRPLWRRVYRAHRRLLFDQSTQYLAFTWRPAPFTSRPPLSDFLFTVEVFTERHSVVPVVSRTAQMKFCERSWNANVLPTRGRLIFADGGGLWTPQSKPDAIQAILEGDSDALMTVRVEVYVSPVHMPERIHCLYIGEYDEGELGDYTRFESERPCRQRGMNVCLAAHVHDDGGLQIAVMVDETPQGGVLVLDEAENIDESSSSDGYDDGSDDEETFSSANGAPDREPSVERTLSSTSFAAYLGCLLWAETRPLRLGYFRNTQDTT